MIDPVNGLPLMNYYDYTSLYWNLIYQQTSDSSFNSYLNTDLNN